MELEDLSLLVRALHRDVTELDERLRKVEELLNQMPDRQLLADEALDLRMVEAP